MTRVHLIHAQFVGSVHVFVLRGGHLNTCFSTQANAVASQSACHLDAVYESLEGTNSWADVGPSGPN